MSVPNNPEEPGTGGTGNPTSGGTAPGGGQAPVFTPIVRSNSADDLPSPIIRDVGAEPSIADWVDLSLAEEPDTQETIVSEKEQGASGAMYLVILGVVGIIIYFAWRKYGGHGE